MKSTRSDVRLLRFAEVQAQCGLGRSTIYRMMRVGTFPEPLRVGERAVRWPEHEINAWLATRPRASGYTQPGDT